MDWKHGYFAESKIEAFTSRFCRLQALYTTKNHNQLICIFLF